MTEAAALAAGQTPPEVRSGDVRRAVNAMSGQLAVNLAGAFMVAYLFASAVPEPILRAWLFTFFAFWLVRLGVLLAFRRAAPTKLSSLGRWRGVWSGGLLLSAALWGAGGWMFHPHLDGSQHSVLIIIGYTLCIAAVPVLVNQPFVFLLFPFLFFGPFIASMALSGLHQGYAEASILLFVFLLTALLVREFRQSLMRTLELQRQTDELLRQLRIEKSSADAARGAAEAANRAKTQFFVAASHDLRQPLHAMGLLAGALRHKNLDNESMQIVSSINESVDELEGLFSQLLDRTRLDSGAIEPKPRHAPLDELYRKLRLRFDPLAFEKGLALRFRGASQHMWADPLLVERIAHNLVSNAIRYTRDGTVLIGCRRRGDRLLLQVWDTGPGIDEHEQARVFDEMYRVPDELFAEMPQRQGLGLGLSIVRRLAALMDAPVTLHSRRGRGSVFTLELPVGHAQPESRPPAVHRPALGLTLKGRRIVLVEADPAASGALASMLGGWGAEVVALEGAAGWAAWAAAHPAALPPDLLLVSDSLQAEGSGLDVIAALREHFGQVTPAIVVSDSALSIREIQTRLTRVHLVVKPVVPIKLRALIGFKLGESGH
jgi:signal transduction histidine kinase